MLRPCQLVTYPMVPQSQAITAPAMVPPSQACVVPGGTHAEMTGYVSTEATTEYGGSHAQIKPGHLLDA